MKIDSFRFHTTDDRKRFTEFVMTLVDHHNAFEVFYEDDNAIVETVDISDKDFEEYREYFENDDDEEDYDYDEPSDLEMGFNPYMGTYDYDC